MLRLRSIALLLYASALSAIPAAIAGPAKSARENGSCGTGLVLILLPPCWPPSSGSCGAAGLAVIVMLPRLAPRCAANHILPLSSDVIHCMNDPVIGTLASAPAPVLGSISATLSISCWAYQRLP